MKLPYKLRHWLWCRRWRKELAIVDILNRRYNEHLPKAPELFELPHEEYRAYISALANVNEPIPDISEGFVRFRGVPVKPK